TIRQPQTARAVLEQRVPACQPFEPPPIARRLPFELDVPSRERRHPADRRPAAMPGVGEPQPVGGGPGLDPRRPVGTSRHPRTSAPAAGSVLAGPRLVMATRRTAAAARHRNAGMTRSATSLVLR